MPTIKYYVREGLLPAGQLTSPNQASYGETHEHRLRLIRALLDVGGLKVSAIAEVLAAVDDPGRSVHKILGVATDLLVARYPESGDGTSLAASRAQVSELIARRGWRVGEDCPAREALATALTALERVGHQEFAGVMDSYADAAEIAARADLGYVGGSAGVDAVVERAIVGTVLGDAMLDALRHLAQVSISAGMYEARRAATEGAASGPG
ncbi:MerR family transcriptional regulator [Streptomyces sp. NPDC001889]